MIVLRVFWGERGGGGARTFTFLLLEHIIAPPEFPKKKKNPPIFLHLQVVRNTGTCISF